MGIIVLLVFAFASPNFVNESMENLDQKVIDRVMDAGGPLEFCKMYADGKYKNPFGDAEDCTDGCPNCLNPQTGLKIINDGGKMRSGVNVIEFGTKYEYRPIYKLYGPSRHFTLIFNVFVWMQIFNFLNARKIEDEL